MSDYVDPYQGPIEAMIPSRNGAMTIAPPAEQDNEARFRWAPVKLAEFFATDFSPQWLVEQIMVKNQPMVIGGIYKTQKTNILMDLAVSLSTGTPFLGRFVVPKAIRVGVLSAESGEGAIQSHLLRVCRSKEVVPATMNLSLMFEVPQLSNKLDMRELKAGIKRDGIEVIFIDPTYLCLFEAGQGDQATNLMITGPLLRKICKTCLDAGATPVLAHHATKHIELGKTMQLNDLAFAGFAEFFRQWVLLNHIVQFDVEIGRAQLKMSVGGSAGHHSLWRVQIDEGKMCLDFKDRNWEVAVSSYPDDGSGPRENQDDRGAAKSRKKDNEYVKKFLTALDELTTQRTPLTKSAIKTASVLGSPGLDRAIFLLLRDGTIEKCTVKVPNGTHKFRELEGFRRKRPDPDDPDK